MRFSSWLPATSMFPVLIMLFNMIGIAKSNADEKPNILFIAVDDLNHWVGHLGRNKQTKTPNLDRLASRGVTFTNAHCAAPVCNPSRAALLSGRRPSTTGVYDNGIPYESAIKADESLFTHLKKNGYETLAMGKLWHGGIGFEEQWTSTGGKENELVTKAKVDDRSIGGIQFGIVDGDDNSVSDTPTANYGIEQLRKSHEQPFVLALGFHKPHMPWNVPKKYFDLHPLDEIELPPTRANDLEDVPEAGKKFAKPNGDHKTVLESGRWKEAVQAYLAAISYLDGQVGRVLDALDDSAYSKNTIIVLWGDHGWHLGEKQHWRKFALWEESTRNPFIWVVPGVTPTGSRCNRPVDLTSIYPTLCELAGLPIPEQVEGKSIKSLLRDPNSDWKGVALTTFGKNNHAVRDDRWRYIRYADGCEELYDHSIDPYEWNNVSNIESNRSIKAELAKHFPIINVDPATGKAGNNRANRQRERQTSK